MECALGIIEIRGLAAAITVADVMAKTAAVKTINIERAQGSGWITVKISGNVAAVSASISAGKQMGEAHGSYVSSKVIPRPAADVSRFFCREPDTKEGSPANREDREKQEGVREPSPGADKAAEAGPTDGAVGEDTPAAAVITAVVEEPVPVSKKEKKEVPEAARKSAAKTGKDKTTDATAGLS